MSDPFPFKVGDKVRLAKWAEAEHVTITAVGLRYFLCEWSTLPNVEVSYPQSETWFRYGAVAA